MSPRLRPRARTTGRHAFALLVAFAMTLRTPSATADDAPLDKAREYFRAGAQAYAVGEYAAAVQAFEQANALAPRPAVLFSIAQAERRLYFVDHERGHLERAVRLYREYLEKDSQGTRKVDTVQALSEIEPLLVSLASSAPSLEPVRPEPHPAATTRLMISSITPESLISLDGHRPSPSPLIAEVTPERHAVRVSAPGYLDTDREVIAVQGALVTLDVTLVEKPARLVVHAPDGALLSIDGRVEGECPLPRPLELSAGPHLITVTKSGLVGISEERLLKRGETEELRASMPRSPQRSASLLMIGAGVSALAAGGVFGYFSLERSQTAQQFLGQRGKAPLNAEDLEQYNSAKDDRDRLRTAALVSAGAGALLVMGGTVLFVMDHRVLDRPPPRSRVGETGHGAPWISAEPLLAPGFAGLGLRGGFN